MEQGREKRYKEETKGVDLPRGNCNLQQENLSYTETLKKSKLTPT